jgi:hypothetical protein
MWCTAGTRYTAAGLRSESSEPDTYESEKIKTAKTFSSA